jgi:hypothetical protein
MKDASDTFGGRRRGCQAKAIPSLRRDPGEYSRGEVVNGSQETVDRENRGDMPEDRRLGRSGDGFQRGDEWAGNSPGWQGMPRPAGDAPYNQHLSHASKGREGMGSRGPGFEGGGGGQHQDHKKKWLGNEYGVDDEQEQL